MPLHIKSGPLGRCPHSFANFEDVSVSHVDLRLKLDFGPEGPNSNSTHSLSGSVALSLSKFSKGANTSVLLLDAAPCITINGAFLGPSRDRQRTVSVLKTASSSLGDCLQLDLKHVDWGDNTNSIETVTSPPTVIIDYTVDLNPSTNSGSISALQWLTADQTEGKKYPLVFSQAQSILARTFVPCQDTPAVKASFDIRLSVRAPLVAVCSGELVNVYRGDIDLGSSESDSHSASILEAECTEESVLDAVACFNSHEIQNEEVNNTDSSSNYYRTWHYHQSTTAQSYLLAFIVGRLGRAPIGRNSFVFAEPECLERAQKELEGVTDLYLDTAMSKGVLGSGRIISDSTQTVTNESDSTTTIVTKVPGYEWGSTFNVAVLPPSFAFGGMENPNCTFFSASLIAGDKSLTTTLAHEIAHSWTGNLVTNKYHKDFWLNEGFTRYVERLTLGEAFGNEFRGLCLIVGYNDLIKTVAMLEKNGQEGYTIMEPDLTGVNPDEAFSRVPYEKGSLFLFYLESCVIKSKELMCLWLGCYLADFSYKSLETKDMREHFIRHFSEGGRGWKGFLDSIASSESTETESPEQTAILRLSQIDWELWLHKPGMPDYKPKVDQSLLTDIEDLTGLWLLESQACDEAETDKSKAESDVVGANSPIRGGRAPLTVMGIRDEKKYGGTPATGGESSSTNVFKHWRAQQIMVFLDLLIENCPLNHRCLKHLEIEYELVVDNSGTPLLTKNVEVFFRYLLLQIRSKRIEESEEGDNTITLLHLFFSSHGRGSYVKPLYLGLKNSGYLDLAKKLFGIHRGFLMDTVQRTMCKALGMEEEEEKARL